MKTVLLSLLLPMVCLSTPCTELKTEMPGAPADNPECTLDPAPANRVYSGPSAIFMGDSISDIWDESGNGHPSFFVENNYVSKGISGQTTAQMLARFQNDVVDNDPGCVVICAGTNDIAGNDNGGVSRNNDYILGNIRAMAEMAVQNNIPVIICSLLPANVYNWNPNVHPADIIVELNGMLKQLAAEKDYAFVDYCTGMKLNRRIRVFTGNEFLVQDSEFSAIIRTFAQKKTYEKWKS